MKFKTLVFPLIVVTGVLAGVVFFVNHSSRFYTSEELGITVIQSELDADKDGIDDYTDIYEGAKSYIATKPEYKSRYYAGGYPDDGFGVCTDVIWNAFKAAGYDLKALVDYDIAENVTAYAKISKPDPNIDFRRVDNLRVFFERNAQSLTTSLKEPEVWQAGDIVVFDKHIAICSTKRNKKGIPFILHHDSKGAREAHDMSHYKIIAHFRWNG